MFPQINVNFNGILQSVGGMVSSLQNASSQTLSSIAQTGINAINEFAHFSSTAIQSKPVQATASVVSKSALILAKCSLEYFDAQVTSLLVGSEIETPENSIAKSLDRLQKLHPELSVCVELLADHSKESLIQKANSTLLAEGIQLEKGIQAYVRKWGIDFIAQTVKANILHIAANLADKAFSPNFEYVFADGDLNPVGRLLSVISEEVTSHQDELKAISLLPKEEQDAHYKIYFKQRSEKLLSVFLPNGYSDLQVFHPDTLPFLYLPCITILKEEIWNNLNQKLAVILEQFYRDYLEMDEKNQNCQMQFDAQSTGFTTEKFLKLPSTLFQKHQNQLLPVLDEQVPLIQAYLEKNGFVSDSANDLSQKLIQYAKELMSTEDDSLLKCASFLENCVMKCLFINLSEFQSNVTETSLPNKVFNSWIQGGVFKVLFGALSGSELPVDDKNNAIQALLAPFGLNQKEKFPLPHLIKEQIWPSIQDPIQNKLPDLLQKNIPKWAALEKKQHHQAEINSFLNDSTLTNSNHTLSETLTDQLFQAVSDQQLIKQKIKKLFPSFTEKQTNYLGSTFNELFENENNLAILKNFSQQCSESFVLQIFNDLFTNYTNAKELNDLIDPLLGDEKNDNQVALSFSEWLVSELTLTFQTLSIENLTASEFEALLNAIHLQKKLNGSHDPEQTKIISTQLEEAWPIINPKFALLTQHLLEILGYDQPTSLPFPSQAQPLIWIALQEHLPKLIFEQSADLLLPVLEKTALQKQLEESSPQGKLLKKGCQILAQDILNHLPPLVKETIDSLPLKLDEALPKYHLSQPAKSYLLKTTQEIMSKDEIYQPTWNWVQSYLESILLKISQQLVQMGKEDFNKILQLVLQTQKKLNDLKQKSLVSHQNGIDLNEEENETPQSILINFTDKIFGCFGIKEPKNLYGIPQPLQDVVLTKIKEKFAQTFLGMYHLDQKIQGCVTVNPLEEDLPTSNIAKAAQTLTNLALDKTIIQLTQLENNQFKILTQIDKTLTDTLEKQEKSGWATATVFKGEMDKIIFSQKSQQILGVLGSQSFQPYQKGFIEWIQPFLTNQVVPPLTSLLQKEKKGQAHFDQTIVMTLMSLFTNHLKQLNLSSQMNGGINQENFNKAFGLYPQTDFEKIKTELEFNNHQTEMLFNLLLPHGKEHIKHILSDLDLPFSTPSDEELDELLASAKKLVSDQFPIFFQAIFNQETMGTIITSVIESLLETLEQPITFTKIEKPILNDQEKEIQKEMGKHIVSFLKEGMKFLDLPIDKVDKLPQWLKTITGVNYLENSVKESVSIMMMEKLDGKVLMTAVQNALIKLDEKQAAEKKEGVEPDLTKTQPDLVDLEKKLSSKSIGFIFKYLGAYIKHSTDVFKNPKLKAMRLRLLKLSTFFIVRILGAPVRYFQLDKKIVDRLFSLIEARTNKLVTVLSQEKLHKQMVMQSVEKLQEVIK